tara:strand:+ start:782 stop:2158 length:1377 start_codon:yes stop_codon:yes gene_type:complete
MKVGRYRYLRSDDVNIEELMEALTIVNPKYRKSLQMGFSTRGLEPAMKLYKLGLTEDSSESVVIRIPRQFPYSDYLIDSANSVTVDDDTVLGEDLKYTDSIVLRDNQYEPVKKFVENENGIVSLPCGAGKTIVGLKALAEIGKPAIVLVHKTFLLNQWRDRAKEFLNEDIGLVGAGQEDWKGRKIVVGMIQSLNNVDKYPKEFYEYFGVVISDEVHRLSAPVWEKVVGQFPARRRWGLTATPYRTDGLECIFKWHIGGMLFIENEQPLTPQVVQIRTEAYMSSHKYINMWGNRNLNMGRLISNLVKDEDRMYLIIKSLKKVIKSGRKLLVLSDRLNSLDELKKGLSSTGADIKMYVGSTSEEDRYSAEDADVILATSQMASEGLDIPDLDTLVLVTPKSSLPWLKQAVGRILRDVEGKKKPLIIDYIDLKIPLLRNMAMKRFKYYKTQRFDVESDIMD